jgi:hypothetical protein
MLPGQQRQLDALAERGFDQCSFDTSNGVRYIRIRCSQCNAGAINGVACHEAGCPNARRARIEAERRESVEEV